MITNNTQDKDKLLTDYLGFSNSNKYQIYKGSYSCHCCFDYSIVKIEKDNTLNNLCEVFNLDTAIRVVNGLNTGR